MTIDSEKLFQLFIKSDFLEMKGLSGEVPIFIQTYDVSDEDKVLDLVDGLESRLKTRGIQISRIDLFKMLLEELDSDQLLDDILKDEKTFDRVDLLDTLKNYCDPKTRIIPRLVASSDHDDIQLTFISGVGHIYPFLRSHSILEALQPAMMNHPVIMFFPGNYTQMEGLGSKLELFGSLPAKRYYRAFNLEHHRI